MPDAISQQQQELADALQYVQDCEAAYERLKAAFEQAKEAFFKAGDRRKSAYDKAVQLVRSQHGTVVYGDQVWFLEGDRLSNKRIGCVIPEGAAQLLDLPVTAPAEAG